MKKNFQVKVVNLKDSYSLCNVTTVCMVNHFLRKW